MNPSCPPPDYVKCARMAGWLRLGKIAVFSILAGLAAAIGLALPDGKDAAAQGVSVQAGYTYTRQYCQELGRQPRFYNVRDPIPGSDWRNDGGWAIVLIRSRTTVLAETRILYRYNANSGGTNTSGQALSQMRSQSTQATGTNPDGYAYGSTIVVNGVHGFISNYAAPARVLVVDRDQNGILDVNDVYQQNPGVPNALWYYERYDYRDDRRSTPVSASYIRWANMLWSR